MGKPGNADPIAAWLFGTLIATGCSIWIGDWLRPPQRSRGPRARLLAVARRVDATSAVPRVPGMPPVSGKPAVRECTGDPNDMIDTRSGDTGSLVGPCGAEGTS
jgi:hypothetical protein